ncbi:hypothetical protein [Adlercreutzia caecimuris]|uniref:hypothetical protein n=1 Tax=Adlercreutzia caecimuris TaxID=671266 RepID=UPI00272A36DE|nr:hypothetical protein [Adlercreutzia caecimuris]
MANEQQGAQGAAQEAAEAPQTDSTATGPEEGAGGAQEAAEGTDAHGHPVISQGKYDREVKKRDDKIAELEAQIAEAAKSQEAAEALRKQVDELKAEQADKDVSYELSMAGCVNEKAAKAVLADYDNDIAKLKEECPYLFNARKPSGSLGLKPSGAPKLTREQIADIEDPEKRYQAIKENIDLY